MKSETHIYHKSPCSQTELLEQELDLEENMTAVGDLIDMRIHSHYSPDIEASQSKMVTALDIDNIADFVI